MEGKSKDCSCHPKEVKDRDLMARLERAGEEFKADLSHPRHDKVDIGKQVERLIKVIMSSQHPTFTRLRNELKDFSGSRDQKLDELRRLNRMIFIKDKSDPPEDEESTETPRE